MSRTITNKILSVTLFTILTTSAMSQKHKGIIGKWQDANHPEKQIEFYQQNNKFYGKSIGNESRTYKNPIIIFKEFHWIDNLKIYKGKLIDPENNDEYDIDINFIGNNKFQFSVNKFVFTKKFTFERINK